MFLYGRTSQLFHLVVRVAAHIVGGQRTVIEPVPEAVEAVFDKVFGRSEVEPRVDCIM